MPGRPQELYVCRSLCISFSSHYDSLPHCSPFIPFNATFKSILFIGGKQRKKRVKLLWCVIDTLLFCVRGISAEIVIFHSFFPLAYFLSVLTFFRHERGADWVCMWWVCVHPCVCVLDFHFTSVCISPKPLKGIMNTTFVILPINGSLYHLHLKELPLERKWLLWNSPKRLLSFLSFKPLLSWRSVDHSSMPFFPLSKGKVLGTK